MVGPGLLNFGILNSSKVMKIGKVEVKIDTVVKEYSVDLSNLPSMIVCFHPGFWGYDSWEKSLVSIVSSRVVCLSSSYNVEESKDDFDKICEVGNKTENNIFLIRQEENKWCSYLSRESGVEGRKCIENKIVTVFRGTVTQDENKSFGSD